MCGSMIFVLCMRQLRANNFICGTRMRELFVASVIQYWPFLLELLVDAGEVQNTETEFSLRDLRAESAYTPSRLEIDTYYEIRDKLGGKKNATIKGRGNIPRKISA